MQWSFGESFSGYVDFLLGVLCVLVGVAVWFVVCWVLVSVDWEGGV